MDPEEQELLHDYRYKNYSSGIEKALRNFESSSEWADLISSLGKLNKETSILTKLADFQKEARRCCAICLMEMLLTGDEHLAL